MTKVKSITIDNSCFTNNTAINSVDCGNNPWKDDSLSNAFKGCTSLTSVSQISNSITNLDSAFEGCSLLSGNINLDSSEISSATDCFATTSLKKNVFIPYESTTYNTLTTLGYDETGSKDGVYLKDKNATFIKWYNWLKKGSNKKNFGDFGTATSTMEQASNTGQGSIRSDIITLDTSRPWEYCVHYKYNGSRGSYTDSWIAGMAFSNKEDMSSYDLDWHLDTYRSGLRIYCGSEEYMYQNEGYFKMEYNSNTHYIVCSKSVDGESWTTVLTSSYSPLKYFYLFFMGLYSDNEYINNLAGSRWTNSEIYFDKTYMKYTDDDSIIWEPITDRSYNVYTRDAEPTTNSIVYTEPKKEYVKLNVNKTGDITISDDCIANISTSTVKSYLSSKTKFSPSSHDWEVLGKFYFTEISNNHCVLGDGYTGGENNYSYLLCIESGKIWFLASSNGTSWDIVCTASSMSIEKDTWYYIKTYFTGTEYKIDVSTDNETWINYHTITNSNPIYAKNLPMLFGSNPYDTTAGRNMLGSIDLKECYVKINDEITWKGCENYTITETSTNKIIVSDGIEYSRNAKDDEYIGQYTLTINPTPSDAVVEMTAEGYTQEGNSITVEEGTSVSYKVSKSGYKTKKGSVVMNKNQTLDIEIVEGPEFDPSALQYGDRLGDDDGVATVVGDYIDGNGQKYKFAVLDAKYMNKVFWANQDGGISGLPNYGSAPTNLGSESATYNTNCILNNYTASDYPAFNHCNNVLEIELGNIIYKPKLPNAYELQQIFNNRSDLYSKDPTKDEYTNYNILNWKFDDSKCAWSSNVASSYRAWGIYYSGSWYDYKKWDVRYPDIAGVLPILEIPYE